MSAAIAGRPVVLLMGPTASGKTDRGVELAEALDGEVISVDSALVYRGLDIGTAKPDRATRARVPHHLIDILEPTEPYSAGQFRDDARACIDAVHGRGRLPLLVGGTMLYFRTLLTGIDSLPSADPAVRAALEAERTERGLTALHAELARVDPQAAARIHPNDPQRIQRALEVWRTTGRPISTWQAGGDPLPCPALEVVLAPGDRTRLHVRIEERFQRMLAHGLIGEVEALRARPGMHADLPAMRAVGYRQVWQYLDGAIDYATMVERGVVATRQLAKRQLTWLRRFDNAIWYDSEHTTSADLAARVQAFLGEQRSG